MDEPQQPTRARRTLMGIVRLGLGIAIFAALAPAPAASSPGFLLEKCPAGQAISI